MPGVDLPSGAEVHLTQQQPSRNSALGLPQHLISLMRTLKHWLQDSRGDLSPAQCPSSAPGACHLLLSPADPVLYLLAFPLASSHPQTGFALDIFTHWSRSELSRRDKSKGTKAGGLRAKPTAISLSPGPRLWLRDQRAPLRSHHQSRLLRQPGGQPTCDRGREGVSPGEDPHRQQLPHVRDGKPTRWGAKEPQSPLNSIQKITLRALISHSLASCKSGTLWSGCTQFLPSHLHPPFFPPP